MGKLVLVATPIGNLGDLSPRAVAALAGADVVAAEDTRRSRALLTHAGVSVPLISYHEHNERDRGVALLDRVATGEVVALVTDAGTPGLADPGFRIVRDAIQRGLAVEAVPGPAAALQALVLSGLPTDRFVFEGYLPRKPGARSRRLAELAAEQRTLLFYVTPHRASDDLVAMADAFGPDRPAALARELTKLHEEVLRGDLAELAARAADGLRGELTLVVAGAPADAPAASLPDLAWRVRELIATGLSKRDAITLVSEVTGTQKREVYQAVVDAPP